MTASLFRLGAVCQLSNVGTKTRGPMMSAGENVASTSLLRLCGTVRQLLNGGGTKTNIINRALLIDGENVSPKYIKSIIRNMKGSGGHPSVRKCFGSFDDNPSLKNTWRNISKELDIELVNAPRAVKGKSSTDMRLCIEAIDLCYQSNPYIDDFGIASSDCDFLPVVQYLQSVKRKVVGFGMGEKSNRTYRDTFDKFVAIDDLDLQVKMTIKRVTSMKEEAKLTEKLRERFEEEFKRR